MITCIEAMSDKLSVIGKDCLVSFLKGQKLSDIAIQNGISPSRTQKIISMSIRKLYNVEAYNKLRDENKELEHKVAMAELEIKELRLKNSDYEKRLMIEARGDYSVWNGIDLSTKLIDLNLSVRTLNSLKAADIDCLAELCVLKREDLLRFKNLGKKSIKELDELLEQKGLCFGMDICVENGKYVVK